jgi:hypothetical protein
MSGSLITAAFESIIATSLSDVGTTLRTVFEGSSLPSGPILGAVADNTVNAAGSAAVSSIDISASQQQGATSTQLAAAEVGAVLGIATGVAIAVALAPEELTAIGAYVAGEALLGATGVAAGASAPLMVTDGLAALASATQVEGILQTAIGAASQAITQGIVPILVSNRAESDFTSLMAVPGIAGFFDTMKSGFVGASEGLSNIAHVIGNRLLSAFTATDPLAIDLSGNGLSLTSLTSMSPYADVSGSGIRYQMGWMGAGTGFLVYLDSSGTPHLVTGSSIGGNGFDGLSQFDANNDGIINNQDAAYSSLYIWEDANNNGVIDPGELQSLASLGVASISLSHSSANQEINGNTVTAIGSVTMTDGSNRELADVNLQTSTTFTQFENLPTISDSIAALPQLHGYGQMMDLQSSMSLNPALENLVQSFFSLPQDTSLATIQSSATAIMYEWAGVTNVDPQSRGGLVDARQIGFLEQYVGQQFTFQGQWDPGSNPQGFPATFVNSAWDAALNGIVARLLVQTDPQIASEFTFNPSTDDIYPTVSLSQSIGDLFSDFGPLSTSTIDDWSKVAIVLDAFRNSFQLDPAAYASAVSQAAVPGLDILQNALGMGDPVSFGTDGRLIVGQGEQTGGHEYVFSAGDGVLEIHNSTLQYVTGQTGYTPDTLALTGIDTADVTTSIDANGNYVLTIGSNGDQVILDGEGVDHLAPAGTPPAVTDSQYVVDGVQSISFDDGTVWNGLWLTGSTASDTIIGPYDGVTYDPRGLSHIIQAVGNDNTLVVNPGCGMVDVVSGGISAINVGGDLTAADVTISADPDGNLTLHLGDGDSVVLDGDIVPNLNGGGYSSLLDTISFADGTSITMGSNPFQFTYNGTDGYYMLGSPVGYDTFNFAPGNNTAVGGGLSDTYNFSAGDGNAVILPSGFNGNIVFGPGLNESDAIYTTDPEGDLTISFSGTTDSLTVLDDFYTVGGSNSRIAAAGFSDGASVNLSYLTFTDVVGPAVTYQASPFGNNFFDLEDAEGSTVYGGATQWNAVNTYYVGKLTGGVTIVPGQYGGTVVIGGDFRGNDLSYSVDPAGDLTVSWGIGQSVTVLGDMYINQRTGAVTSLVNFAAADGLFSPVGNFTLSSAVGPDQSVTGSEFGPTAFNLDNATGATITGGAYSADAGDTYNVGALQGNVTIVPGQYTGYVVFGPGITANMLSFTADVAGDVTVGVNGTSTSVTIDNELYVSGNGNEYSRVNILMADGSEIGPVGNTMIDIPVGPDQTASGSDLGPDDFILDNAAGSTVTATQNYTSYTVNQQLTGDVVINGRDGDELNFGPGITQSMVTLTQDGSGDLIVSIAGQPGSLTFMGDAYGYPNQNLDNSRLTQLNFAVGPSEQVQLNRIPDDVTVGGGQLVNGTVWGPNVVTGASGGGTVTGGYIGDTLIIGHADAPVTFEGIGGGLTLQAAPGLTAADIGMSVDSAGDLTVCTDGVAQAIVPTDVFNEGNGPFIGTGPVYLADGTPVAYNAETSLPVHFAAGGGAEVAGSSMGASEFTIASGGGTVDPGAYANTYDWNGADGDCTISASYGTDPGILKLVGPVSEANLWLGQVGNNLQVTELGTASSLTVDNFFSGSASLNEIAASDGMKLFTQDIVGLTSAMDTYVQNNPEFSTAAFSSMPTDTTLHAAFAAAWH